jgi:hypothetical protein
MFRSALVYRLVGILLVFLSLSAWLVSITGIPWITLIRDGLWFAVVVVGLFYVQQGVFYKSKRLVLGAILGYAVLMILSALWTEASFAQVLKGWRFMVPPVLIMGLLSVLEKPDQVSMRFIRSCVLIAAGIIVVPSLLEVFGLPIPVVGEGPEAIVGALTANHLVGSLTIPRVQGLLSGPNSLGLACVAMLGALVVIRPKVSKSLFLAIAILVICVGLATFSRAALLGMVILGLGLAMLHLLQKAGRGVAIAVLGGAIGIAVIGTVIGLGNPVSRDLLLHADSTELRFEQYQRVVDSRTQIGLFGEGSGTAGPASQYRVDGGPNNWTENVFFDVFQEVGLVGLLLFCGIWIASGIALLRSGTTESRQVVVLIVAMLMAGSFIHLGTGQVGFWLLCILTGFALQKAR